MKTVKQVSDPFRKTRNNESYSNMPLIKLYKCNAQEDDDKQDKAFNLNDARYGPLKRKSGNDIKEDRQGHDQ